MNIDKHLTNSNFTKTVLSRPLYAFCRFAICAFILEILFFFSCVLSINLSLFEGSILRNFHNEAALMGLWANIAQVIFLCNVGPGRSRQLCIVYFPEKITLLSEATLHK